jgi:polyisoprenoid-binding protein YceI
MNARTLRHAVALLSLAPAGAGAQQKLASLQQYQLDAGHSIFYDPVNPENSSVTIIAPSKSLDTGWGNRDRHLKTSDFFDVEKYPTVMFQSTRLRRNGQDWLMDGNLMMHGVTKTMSIPVVMPAPRRSPESGWMILTATSTFKLARKDFGITGGDKYNAWFNAARQATTDDTVDISIEVEGWWADAASQRPAILPALQRVRSLGVQAQIDTVKRRLSPFPDSVRMDYFSGADLLVRELLEEDPAKAVQLASA